jgi:hypothetical protein
VTGVSAEYETVLNRDELAQAYARAKGAYESTRALGDSMWRHSERKPEHADSLPSRRRCFYTREADSTVSADGGRA